MMSIWLELYMLAVLVFIVADIACVLYGISTDGGPQREIRRAQTIKRIHQDTIEQIDETAAYYAGLYRYISRRLEEETRRRRSSR